jgi:hypothetical protein
MFLMLIVIPVASSTMHSRCSTNVNELPLKIIYRVAVDRHCQPEKRREVIIKDGFMCAKGMG